MKINAYPVKSDCLSWVPLWDALSLLPFYFAADGYAAQLRVD